MATQHFDCLIIGAGISGIDAAYYLKNHCSWAKFAVLERRANLGGTWDFFKYPGLRSDSDMHTFGFSWKLWKSEKTLATAEEILNYLYEAVGEQDLKQYIRFNTDIRSAEWSTRDARWHLKTSDGIHYSCNLLFGCTGYYSYETPYRPKFPEEDSFKGPIIHPQEWTEEANEAIKGKKVAIIGSGATAVTILPNISDVASKVTMVQRTPSYIINDSLQMNKICKLIGSWFPERIATSINQWINIAFHTLFYKYCIQFPSHAKKVVKNYMWNLMDGGMPKDEFDKNFTPPYNPWEQRLCMTPAADFFDAIKAKKASVATGNIERFTEDGIQLEGGDFVDADVIISATGLTLQPNFPFSTMAVTIDGVPYKSADRLVYKGIMLSDVPNFAFIFGYLNESWTLKADIGSIYFCKLLNHMRVNEYTIVRPHENEADECSRQEIDLVFTSGYLKRAAPHFPRQGTRYPWTWSATSYPNDLTNLMWNGVADTPDDLEFVAN